MAGLSPTDNTALRDLAARCSDTALARIVSAFEAHDGSAAAVRTVFSREAEERRVRSAVFSPLRPFVAPGAGAVRPRLPADAKIILWSLARAMHPDICDHLLACTEGTDSAEFASPANALCLRLAQAMARAETEPAIRARAALDALPGGAEAAIALLPLAAHIRRAGPKLAAWTHHLTGKSATELRQAFGAAAKLGEDAGPLYLEALSGLLPEPCQVLRMISLILDQPTDQFLAEGPLGPLAERLISQVDAAAARVQAFQPGEGDGNEVGAGVMAAAATLLEFEQWVDVGRFGPWGERLTALRRSLAVEVEERLKLTPKLMAQALPTRSARWTQRSASRIPKLSQDPDALAVEKARDHAAFLGAIRKSPSTSGFAALLARVCEELDEQLDSYVEGLLDLLHRAAPVDRPRINAHLESAARLTEAFGGEPAGRIVRRRAAAA